MRFFLTTFLVVVLGWIGTATGHNILLRAHSRECFHEDLHKDDKMTVTFQTGDREFGGSGNLEINFWVEDPAGASANITHRRCPLGSTPSLPTGMENMCTALATKPGHQIARRFLLTFMVLYMCRANKSRPIRWRLKYAGSQKACSRLGMSSRILFSENEHTVTPLRVQMPE